MAGLVVIFRGLFLTAALIVALSQGVEARSLTDPARDPSSCTRAIDVNLTAQRLVATLCDRVFVTSSVTSGRLGLRTPTGTFTVFLKEQDVTFFSPWPQGDPNYYPPMQVAYALEFLDGGYYLHTDPDEPKAAFGQGSEDGPYASHGCVHVPVEVMVKLYAWAGDGTAVTVHY